VSQIFVDLDATSIEGAGEPSVDPVAVRSLGFLRDAGHEVVLVAEPDQELPADLREIASEVVDEVPMVPRQRAWYLTSEVERCTGTSARLRTVLIGAAPPAGSIHRCDAVSRDLRAAALELLASEAMPSR
jgi:hypothetical protein